MIHIAETATRIKLSGERRELEPFYRSLRFKHPNAFRSEKYLLYQRTRHLAEPMGWDGYINPLRWVKGNALVGGRGLLDRVVDLAEEFEVELDREGLLARPFNGLEVDDVPDDIIHADFKLDEDQVKAVVEWLVHAFGIHQFTVGAGKTAMFCAAAAMVKRRFEDARFLYIVPTERLVRQVTKESRKFLPHFAISQFGGGVRDESGRDMVVATSAMLNKHLERLREEGWTKTFMGLLVDESHHASSPSNREIIESVPAFFRFGASDSTKEDDPIKSMAIQALLGPIRHVLGAEKLIEAGRLARPSIYLVDCPEWNNQFARIGHSPDLDSDAWALIDGDWMKGTYLGPVFEKKPDGEYVLDRKGERVQVPNYQLLNIAGEEVEVQSKWCLLERANDKAIITFKPRNKLIVEWAKHYSDQGFPTLVVCTRTIHILILQGMLEKAVDPELVRVLFSEHTSKQRDETFDWLRRTPGAILISPLCKEGVSINEIRAGVVADFIAGYEYANQIIGRFLRRKQGDNECHITWFVDRQTPNYRQKSLRLFRHLEKIKGYTYYHPCRGPKDLQPSLRFAASDLAQPRGS